MVKIQTLIDFVKIFVNDNDVINSIEKMPFIHKTNYDRKVNIDTGEEFITHYFEFDNSVKLTWKDYQRINPLEIRIKPHYYFNSGMHNANDFSPIQCIKTLNDIFTRLGLNNALERLKIVNLEYGVNFLTAYSDTKCIDEVYLHSTNLFYNIKDLPYCKSSYQPNQKGKANQYKQFKFYSKYIQHPSHCDKNTLRAEIKSNRSSYINRLGIYTANDLLEPRTYDRLSNELIKESKQLFFLQEVENKSALTPNQRTTVRKMTNPRYWQKVLKNDRSKFSRKKAQYFNILDRTGYNLTKSVITAISSKIKVLNNIKSGAISSTPKRIKSGAISTISIGRILPTSKKCPITGIDISMQKDNSFLLSNTGFKHLEKTDPKEFERLKCALLTGNYNKFEKTIYSKLSKQVRNRYNNIKLYHDNQLNLFIYE